MRNQGALDEERIIEGAQELVKEKLSQNYDHSPKEAIGLVERFSEAKNANQSNSIDIKNIFKEDK